MRYLSYIMLLGFLSCHPHYKPHKIIIEPNFVEVHFGRVMSRSLLDSISGVLAKQGIQLTFPVLKYDGEKLNELEFVISDGINTGTAKTNFVYKGKPFGFRVNHKPGIKPSLLVGELK